MGSKDRHKCLCRKGPEIQVTPKLIIWNQQFLKLHPLKRLILDQGKKRGGAQGHNDLYLGENEQEIQPISEIRGEIIQAPVSDPMTDAKPSKRPKKNPCAESSISLGFKEVRLPLLHLILVRFPWWQPTNLIRQETSFSISILTPLSLSLRTLTYFPVPLFCNLQPGFKGGLMDCD